MAGASTTSGAAPGKACRQVAIVGQGPRGVIILERMCASGSQIIPSNTLLKIHVIDPWPPGPGSVWRTTQPPELLMNTLARQTTLFTDMSVVCSGPICAGPSLYSWAAEFEQAPEDYATRAQYGRYIAWAFNEILRKMAPNISIVVHTALATRLDDSPDGTQRLTLSTGCVISDLAAVVLAQGHLPMKPTTEQNEFIKHARKHCLNYILPANPAEVDLTSIAHNENVLLHGLGLNSIDYMVMLTEGRGGRFVHENGKLHYYASGKEPRLFAGCRRGIPNRARGDSDGTRHDRYTPVTLTDDVIARFRGRAGSQDTPNFKTEVWPYVQREVEYVYYEAVLRELGLSNIGFRHRFLANIYDRDNEAQILNDFKIPENRRWSWDRIQHPYDQDAFVSFSSWQRWLLDYLHEDVTQAKLGIINGPVMAALDALRDLRRQLRLIIERRGLTGTSRRDDVDRWFTPLNAFLSGGPPRQRIEQMIALIEANILSVLAPRLEVKAKDRAWVACSPDLPEETTRVTTLIEARLPELDIGRTADDLLNYLQETGQCRQYNVDGYETGRLDVAPGTCRLIDRHGREHPRRFAVGGPTESWASSVVARPNVNSRVLRQLDAVARGVLCAATHGN
ncbi:FAD-NAD(P)-binding-domain-containing protein [Xylaria intraflava]|nr:FAD-NAD(P)-binding-domain-containing protein [Xylaria intraflava]